jgi:hypothetical protein
VTGILEMFRELSEPDEFHSQAQLELFAWRRSHLQRIRMQRYTERLKFDQKRLEARRAYQRAWRKKFWKRKKKDKEWLNRRRKTNRDSMARAKARAA